MPDVSTLIINNQDYALNAKKLTTARNIKLVGDVTGNADFDGSKNIEINTTVAGLDEIHDYIGYNDTDVYGIEVDYTNKKCTRLAGAIGKTPGTNFDTITPFGGRYRCIVADDGTEVAKHGDEAYTETGKLEVATAGKAIGDPVQVMVKQPQFFYRVIPLVTEPIADGKGYHLRKARYYVSATPREGFKLHPAFIVNGEEKQYIYLSAYEATFYDVDGDTYILDDTAVTAEATDKIASIAGAQPYSGKTNSRLTRAKARQMAHNRGDKWDLSTAATISASQLLMMIEYGTLNLQTALGSGIVNDKDDSTSNLSHVTGGTASLGNKSGTATTTTSGSSANVYVSYRGEENLWGNIWTWVDGLNIYPYGEHSLYVADHDFADSKKDGVYKDAGFTLAKANGYVSAFGYSSEFDWLFMPSEVKGDSSVPVGDYFYQNNTYSSGFMVARLGARWGDGVHAGPFCWFVDDTVGVSGRDVGARAVCR